LNKNQILLESNECSFEVEDQYSTVISSKFPNIFLEIIANQTFAIGRIFEEKHFDKLEINQWHLFRISVRRKRKTIFFSFDFKFRKSNKSSIDVY